MKPTAWRAEELEEIPCDACKKTESRPLVVRPDGMQVVECVSCGLTYLNPRPKAELIPRLYDQSYFTKTEDNAQLGYSGDYLTAESRAAMISAGESKLRCLQPFWQPRGTKCLEVGCSTGEFSHVLKQCGANPVGVDFSEFAILQARKLYPGIDFRVGDIETVGEVSAFEAVVGFELVEHLVSPSRFLKHVHRLLKPGGTLVLSTPNLDCGKAIGYSKWLGFQTSFEHLYFLDQSTLARLGKPYGLKMQKWFTGNGNGDVPARPKPRLVLRTALRSVLDQVGLLGLIRSIRRKRCPQRQKPGFAVEGRQHTLLAVMRKLGA